jgi:hypothetical protein
MKSANSGLSEPYGVIGGIGHMGSGGKLGRIFVKTMGSFVSASLCLAAAWARRNSRRLSMCSTTRRARAISWALC